jgi:hypothetical protein
LLMWTYHYLPFPVCPSLALSQAMYPFLSSFARPFLINIILQIQKDCKNMKVFCFSYHKPFFFIGSAQYWI